ncbi:MAG: DUF2064 domain-containing protein [Myxococcales bacterium]|nr:DUF2064 domain-containing protein [Myxococcales bacterium]
MDTAIVVFARSPEAEAKRLTRDHRQSCLILEGLVAHTLDTAMAVSDIADIIVACDGPLDLDRHAPKAVLRQQGRGFEARIINAASDAASLGYKRIIVLGADSPSLTVGDLRDAVSSEAELVVGPASDGGVYLFGLPAGDLDLLRGLPWKLASLRHRLTERARTRGWRIARLATRRDIDRIADVARHRRVIESICLRFLSVSPFPNVRAWVTLEVARPHSRRFAHPRTERAPPSLLA